MPSGRSWLTDDRFYTVWKPPFRLGRSTCVSVVTELELLSYGGLTDEDMQEIAHLLTSLVVFPLESRLAQMAAALRRQYRLKTPDSIVAATALLTRTTLVTRNVQDFQGIVGFSLLPI